MVVLSQKWFFILQVQVVIWNLNHFIADWVCAVNDQRIALIPRNKRTRKSRWDEHSQFRSCPKYPGTSGWYRRWCEWVTDWKFFNKKLLRSLRVTRLLKSACVRKCLWDSDCVSESAYGGKSYLTCSSEVPLGHSFYFCFTTRMILNLCRSTFLDLWIGSSTSLLRK